MSADILFLQIRAFTDKGPVIFTHKVFFTDKGLTESKESSPANRGFFATREFMRHGPYCRRLLCVGVLSA